MNSRTSEFAASSIGAATPLTGPTGATRREAANSASGGATLVHLMWFVVLCAPQWWLAAHGLGPAPKIPTVLFALLLLVALARGPRTWFAPLLAFVGYTVITVPVAFDRGQALEVAKALVAYYALAIGTLALARSVRHTVVIVSAAMMYSYIWWILWGAKSGQVAWHPALANYDAFGPLMVIGLGGCYYFGMATSNKWVRRIAFAAAAGCAVGLVSSYARGAVLSGAAVVLWVWLRSPRKVASAVAVAAGVVAIVVAASLFKGSNRGDANSDFWTEMSSISAEVQSGAPDDRQVLWALARREFLMHPILGVGPGSFGAFGAATFQVGQTGGAYDENPGRLWGRQLHNTYYQLLCEFGTVGCGLFLWVVIDFVRRNRTLRRPEFAAAWKERSGGSLDLVHLSLGLEAGMVGFFTTAVFYNQIFDEPWFYTIVIVNALLYYHARPGPRSRGVMVGRRRG